MKITTLSAYDNYGGAGKAAYRLHQGLQTLKLDCSMLVKTQNTDNFNVKKLTTGAPFLQKFKYHLQEQFFKIYIKKFKNNALGADRAYFSFINSARADKLLKSQQINQSDIVHLHWINDQFLHIRDLQTITRPIIWTLHDCWSFTGGCHHFENCEHFMETCGNCPRLKNKKTNDISAKIWNLKQKIYQSLNITIVAPSNWIATCAKKSSLLKSKQVVTIPNPIDTKIFSPIPKNIARNILQLPQNEKILLAGSLNPFGNKRKGFKILQQTLQFLKQKKTKLHLLILGASQDNLTDGLAFPSTFLGYLHDDISLRLAYSAADVFVLPSLYENLPNSLVESLACGTPAVAFNIGGNKDIIEHQKTGFLATPYEIDSLADAILWSFEANPTQIQILAKEKIDNIFAVDKIAKTYFELYKKVLK